MRKLSYGTATNKSAPNVRFGIEKGFFREEGIDLDIHLIYGGPQLARAFEAGEGEIGELVIGGVLAVDDYLLSLIAFCLIFDSL